jgi:hypothetical protein
LLTFCYASLLIYAFISFYQYDYYLDEEPSTEVDIEAINECLDDILTVLVMTSIFSSVVFNYGRMCDIFKKMSYVEQKLQSVNACSGSTKSWTVVCVTTTIAVFAAFGSSIYRHIQNIQGNEELLRFEAILVLHVTSFYMPLVYLQLVVILYKVKITLDTVCKFFRDRVNKF